MSTLPDSFKPTELDAFTKSHHQKEEQTASHFVNLLEQISAKKLKNTNDLHSFSRPGTQQSSADNRALYKSSAFIGRKSQGGGYYPLSSKSDKSHLHSQMLMSLKQKSHTPTRYTTCKMSEPSSPLPGFGHQTQTNFSRQNNFFSDSKRISDTRGETRKLSNSMSSTDGNREFRTPQASGRVKISQLIQFHNDGKQTFIQQQKRSQDQ